MQEYLRVEIDWSVGQKEFREQVRRMIAAARKNGKVIVLPVAPRLEAMLLTLSCMNCDDCDALCCKISPPDGLVALTPSECGLLTTKYGERGIKKLGEAGGAIEMPCRFLHKSRCTIYAERPLACIVFPLQPGGSVGVKEPEREALALSSYCPGARRIARAVYMTYWRIKQKVWSIGLEEANKLLMMDE